MNVHASRKLASLRSSDKGLRERLHLNRDGALLFGERYGLVVVFGLAILWFSVWGKTSEVFPTSDNFNNIVGNQSVLAVAALAAIIPLVAGQFDLSVGAVLGVSSVLSAKLLAETGLPLAVCGLAGVMMGAGVGALNGVIVARLGVNSLITTLGASTILAGVSSALAEQPIVSGIPLGLSDFGSGKTVGVPNTLFVLLGAALVVWYLLEQTPFGRSLHALGSNRSAAKLVGLSVERLTFRAFVLSGALAGAAGVLQLARSGTGDPAIGVNFTLPALAAAFLGATVIKPGRFNVLGTLVAIFFLAVCVNGMVLSGADPFVQDLFNGAALVFGVAISTLIARQRMRGRRSAA
jgi:ribose transport system permease protein